MYYKEGSNFRCGYTKLQSEITGSKSEAETRKVIEKFFNIDEEEVDSAVERISKVLQLGEYFTFVFDKSLLDTKAKDLDELMKSQLKFEAWKTRTHATMSFNDMVRTIHFVKTTLR
jgi:hypothetical protein